VRLAAYVDAAYFREGGVVSTPESFPLFVAQVGSELDGLVLPGRLHPDAGRSHHVLPPDVEFVALPWYGDLGRPAEVARALGGSVRAFWAVCGRADALFLPGPHPFALPLIAVALLRGTTVVLGVRQNTREYARHRHPHRRVARFALYALEWLWQLLARRLAVAPVGPELAALYRRAPRLYELDVSMVRDADLAGPEVAAARSYDGPIVLLSVGRLETEKNPLMLADVLAELVRGGGQWRLKVCGEGPLRADLEARLAELGVAEHAELLGYVPVDGGLMDLYRSSDALLHTSWTEGLPQILFEAFAARLPVVASDVGGVPAAVGDAALLVAAGDVAGAAAAVRRVASDAELRERMTEAGAARVASRTLEASARGLARWLREVA
jgi:glycosyltransferase involved in cell wall biosynthesis